jgi:hypothetical protein
MIDETGGSDIECRRQGLWHECHNADASLPNNRFVFMLSRAPELSAGPPWPVDYPFARWAIIKRNQWPNLGQANQALQNDYVLFCSNFNGRWDQYIPDPLVGNHSPGTKTCPKPSSSSRPIRKTERYPA